eukprot:SAG11_NODE_637_length_8033_cov_4.585707_13_plen_180_part_00
MRSRPPGILVVKKYRKNTTTMIYTTPPLRRTLRAPNACTSTSTRWRHPTGAINEVVNKKMSKSKRLGTRVPVPVGTLPGKKVATKFSISCTGSIQIHRQLANCRFASSSYSVILAIFYPGWLYLISLQRTISSYEESASSHATSIALYTTDMNALSRARKLGIAKCPTLDGLYPMILTM